MEQTIKSSNESVIGSQCMRQPITYNSRLESYSKEQKKEKEDSNNIIKEKSDSNEQFIMNNTEFKNCKTPEESIKVLTNFMQEGCDDFKNRTGRNPSISEIRAMYG